MQIEFNEEKHEYTVEGEVKPSVTEILGFITADHYGAINPSVLDRAARRGSAVHECLEDIDYDIPPEEVPTEIYPYVVAYQTFLRDYKPEWYGIEQRVYNPEFDYCGTIDRWGKINGEYAVLDIKTYDSPTRENYLSLMGQTYAYGIAVNRAIKKRYGLFLKKNGTYRLVDCDEYADKFNTTGEEVFTRCREFYEYLRKAKTYGRRKRNDSV